MKKPWIFLVATGMAAYFLFLGGPPCDAGNPDRDMSNHREPSGDLSLRQALELALARNPDLASVSWELRSGDPRIRQAGLIPNPELAVDLENFLGSEPYSGFDSLETTLSISQLLELGGKRAARIRLASSEKEVSRWDYEAKRADLAAEVAKSFVDVLAAQQRLALAEELTRLAKEVLNAVAARVVAGKVSPVEETKASVAHSTSQINLERARRAIEAARKKLAALWGSPKPVFSNVVGRLDDVAPIPSAEDLADRISRNPDVARWAAELDQRRAAHELERASRIPDVTLGGGIRFFREANDTTFVFGATIPLPVFHRNQGKILESQYGISKAERERDAAGSRILVALSDAYQALAASYLEATILKSAVLPGAQSAFEASSEGFRQGKFGYLDVLDAQRTLFESKDRYVEALSAYHKAVADTERLIGGSLGEPQKSIGTRQGSRR